MSAQLQPVSGPSSGAVFSEFLARYRKHCGLFVREVLGVTPEAYPPGVQPWQDRVMADYDAGKRRISAKSGHGVGKSAVLSWIMVHHLLCRFPQKTIVTAPSSTQLFDAIWPEFKTWIGRLPPPLRDLLEVKSDRVELKEAPEESFTSARTSRAESPDALQGVHAQAGWVLLIADEASGIPEAVYEAAVGSMAQERATTILAGNPVRAQGFFYDTHSKLADMWATYTVSCLDCPLVPPDYVEQVKRTYGENSNAYRIRVLGEFPVSEDDVVVPFDLVEAALGRDVQPARAAPIIWGVDCARFGNDRSALAKRRAHELLEPIRSWTKLDNMELAGRIKLEYDTAPVDLRPAEINIDVIGLGAGVVDRLRQLGLPARGVNVSEAPAVLTKDRYKNLRAELWFKAREWFARRDCVIPKQDDFIRELTRVKYKFTPGSDRILVESKEDMKRRGQDSPDLADAFILTLASEAVTLTHGRFGSTSWNTALHRPLKGIV